MATILIGADICPIGENLAYFEKGDAARLFNDLLPEIQNADFSIGNLECPFIKTQTPIAKTGPIFGAPNSAINGIKNSGLRALVLANNHILDHGPEGLKNTLEVCAAAGIETVGAGKNLEEARRILIKEFGGLRVGIFAVAEHEFSIARPDAAGANPLDLIDFVRIVRAHREKVDYLIVLLHGSAEFLVPTPRTQKTCRFMIEMGANAVLVQHPHCLGGYEEYGGGHIVYGQGALVMDEEIYRRVKTFHEGYLVKLVVDAPARAKMEIIPFVQSSPAPGARKLTGDDEKRFRVELEKKSAQVKDASFVERQWIEFCEERKHSFLSSLLGHNRALRKLNSGGSVTSLLYSRKALLRVQNLIRCETHRETLETIFKQKMI
jgi:poly-gamma-glutamate capsule biosynthesis protein CapA/YwtB (metallophosphatase superfamily)